MAPGSEYGSGKATLRRQLRQRRAALLPQVEAQVQQQAWAHVPPVLGRGGRLGIYWPLPGEVDLRGLAQHAELHGRLALPRVENGGLQYRAWDPTCPLSPDATGIPAPNQGLPLTPQQLGVLLVPALGLDRRGLRLGYGGGWFDRLRAEPLWRAVPALAVLPSGCLLEALPADPWDLPFPGWLDEQGLHWLQPV